MHHLATILYYFTGHEGPDSCCIDSDDNLYVAMYGQGRVLVFNKRGYPIGQILMPGRDDGKMLRTTHLIYTWYKSTYNLYLNIETILKVDLCFIQLMVLLKDMRVINFNKLLKKRIE